MQRWTLLLRGPLGMTLLLEIIGSQGEMLFRGYETAKGEIALYDLGLSPGTYRIHLSPAATTPAAYRLRATAEGPRVASREDEPSEVPGTLTR